jgi:hypothetical protein
MSISSIRLYLYCKRTGLRMLDLKPLEIYQGSATTLLLVSTVPSLLVLLHLFDSASGGGLLCSRQADRLQLQDRPDAEPRRRQPVGVSTWPMASLPWLGSRTRHADARAGRSWRRAPLAADMRNRRATPSPSHPRIPAGEEARGAPGRSVRACHLPARIEACPAPAAGLSPTPLAPLRRRR